MENQPDKRNKLLLLTSLAKRSKIKKSYLDLLARQNFLRTAPIAGQVNSSLFLLPPALRKLNVKPGRIANHQAQIFYHQYKSAGPLVAALNRSARLNPPAVNADDARPLPIDPEEDFIAAWLSLVRPYQAEIKSGLFSGRPDQPIIRPVDVATCLFPDIYHYRWFEKIWHNPFAASVLSALVAALVIVVFSPLAAQKIPSAPAVLLAHFFPPRFVPAETAVFNVAPAEEKDLPAIDSKQLSDFIRRRADELSRPEHSGQENFFFSREDLLGQVAGDLEKR